jgi:aldose 1-epimerase
MNTNESNLREEKLSLFAGGLEMSAWTLSGKAGLSATILNYGGIVQKLLTPDAHGNLTDVVLGFEKAEDYIGDHPYFGAIAGRVAGRITAGKLKINNTRFSLPVNDPPHHLHGGLKSIDRRLWNAEAVARKDGHPSLRLTLVSEDGENNYPGRVELAVTYTVTADNHLLFETEATSDRLTPVSLTHHSYFNLGGEDSGPTDGHEVQILSDAAFLADEWMGLTGELHEVKGRPNEARTARRMGNFVKGLWKEHGDLYWLGESRNVRPVARLRDPISGRVLEVATDCSCLQFYSGKGLDGSHLGKSGTRYQSRDGVCFECEGYPNGFGDEMRYGSILVEPGVPQTSRTEYRFSHSNSSLIIP